MKTIVIIPAYNEEKNIKNVINDIKKELKNIDILVINDNSTDNTRKIITDENIRCINLPYNMGYSKAVQTGIKFALYNGYDYCLQMDADGQHLAKEAKKLIDLIQKKDVDIVIGSRFLEKTDYQHSNMRKLGTRVLSWLIMAICNIKITDPTSGFQCINRKTMERFSNMGNYPEFPDANLIIELLLEDFNIEEVPTIMKQREFGTSMHSGIIKPIKYMIKVLYTIVIIVLRNLLRRNKK